MKKRLVKLLIYLLLIFPIFINAENVSYERAKDKVNNYIRLSNFSDRKKYINLDESIPYIYENGNLVQSNTFYRGGMLSKTEYELSQTNGSSYLTLGLKFWTLTPGNGGKQYYVENYLDQREKNEPAAVRSTIFAKSNVYVVGKGTYSIPWEFKIFHTVRIMPKANGRVECAEENCTVVNTTAIRDKVTSGSDVVFRIVPNACYEYAENDQCNLKNTTGNTYRINNVTSDIRCVAEFSPITYVLLLSAGEGVEYKTNPSLDKIYFKYNVGMYSDSTTKDKFYSIGKPTRKGYQFRGYYYGDTLVIDENGNLIESQRKQITGFGCNNSRVQELVAHWEPNKMYITYDKNGATEYNDPANSIYATLLYDGSDYSAETGLPNYACKKGDCWFAFSKAGYHGTLDWLVGSKNSTIKISVDRAFAKNQYIFEGTGSYLTSFENNYETSVTLYAEWIQCPAGTYKLAGTGGTSCTGCAAGSFQPSAGQTECLPCAVGSYTTEAGNSACTPCQPSGASGTGGTTSSTGQNSCNASCNKSHVSTWNTQYWSNNSTSPICSINTCAAGYHLTNNVCEPNVLKITYNAAGGSDLNGATAIPYTAELKYDGITYSGEYGMPDYIGNSTWKLSKAGYVGTRYWLVGGTSSTTKISTEKSFATNQDVATDLGVLNSFKTNSVTEVNLYAEWVPCGAGTYNDGTVSTTACSNCGAGYYSSGSANESCGNCGPGKYSSGTANTTCSNCGPGKYSSGTNNTTCSNCGPGKYSSGTSNIACSNCGPGYYSNGTSNTACSNCGAGYYSSGTSNTACSNCGPGYYSNGTNNTACSNCGAGYYSNGANNTTCSNCGPGYYSSGANNTACSNCGAGYYSSGTNNTACGNCGPGKYSSGTNNTQCTNCTAGTFSTGANNSSCTNCVTGSISSAGSSLCTACQPSGASGTGGTTSAAGKSSCDTSCNKSHVATWETASWTNNSVTNLCTIATCETNYNYNPSTKTCESSIITNKSAYVIALDTSNKIQCRVDFIYSYDSTNKSGSLDVTSVTFTHTSNSNYFYNNNVFFLGGGCLNWYNSPSGGGWCLNRDYSKSIYFGSTKFKYWNNNKGKYEDYFNYDQGDACIGNNTGTNSLYTCTSGGKTIVSDFDDISIAGNSSNKIDVKFDFSGVHIQGGSSITWNRTVTFNLLTGVQE